MENPLNLDSHPYNSDRPIASAGEDILGRSAFATELAKDIQSWRGRDSLVVGIYGKWGEGKTSLKNLILENYRRGNSQSKVIEFNPWQFSGTENITAALFNDLEVVFTKDQNDAKQTEKTYKFRMWSKLLCLAGFTATLVGDACAAAGNDDIALTTKSVGAAATVVSKVFEAGNDAANVANDPKAKSISSLKRELVELFEECEDPILFVIDDIDRLTTSEILKIFQFVKANADFPRIVYLLLFDRQVVANALNDVSSGKGESYLEKIVQVPLHIPKTSKMAVDALFGDEINKVMDRCQLVEFWDVQRWHRMQRAILSSFDTIRDVKRFIASFSFHFGHFLHKGDLDVNSIDLIVLESLRVFFPSIYERLASEKETLTSWSYGKTGNRANEERHMLLMNELNGHVAERQRPFITAMIDDLFPNSGWDSNWHKHLRVCDKEMFDRYFTLTIPQTEVRQSVVNQLIHTSESAAGFVEQCKNLLKENRLESALYYLDSRIEDIPVDRLSTIIQGLCDISDAFLHSRQLIRNDAIALAWRIVYFGLKKVEPTERFAILLKAIRRSKGLPLAAQIVSHDERRTDAESKPSDHLVNEAQWVQLRDSCLPLIRKRSRSKEFRQSSWLMYMLYRWGQWQGNRMSVPRIGPMIA